MEKIYLGIDISKDYLDCAACESQTFTTVDIGKVDNTLVSIRKLIKTTQKTFAGKQLWWCFEHTGKYGLLLASVLEDLQQTYSVVPALEIQRSIGIQRGKDDVVDARRIAVYATTQAHKLRPSSLPEKQLMVVKQLLSYRSLMVKMRTQLKNSLKGHKLAEKYTPGEVIKDIEGKISGLNDDIEKIDDQISLELKTNQDIAGNFQLVTSVTGVGLIIAAYMLVYTNNFNEFDNARKFACYAGVAPFEHSSGSSIRGKTQTSSLRNKTIKTVLYNGANSAVQHDPQLKNYLKRKLGENKNRQSVINAVACKMVYRIFATVKRQSNYVVLQY